MLTLIAAILKAIAAGFNVFHQERALRNDPAMVKSKTAQAIQDVTDKLNRAEAVAADPHATKEEHEAAIREIRLAHS